MPSLTFPVTPDGLAVPVWVGLAGKATVSLRSAGQAIPSPLLARGLLDTGSNVTAIATWVFQRLAVPVAATGSTQTAAGPVVVNLYEVSLSITDPGLPGAPMLTCSDLLASELATVLPDADVLVGLDVLLGCRLTLDGPGRWFTLEF
ncbi:MAG TPA: hypothetical protein VFE78_34785 [Gemmataceae bacterium]|jgi:hypothetical protein|nr:hypothetical protein [Gemmataceae bacterium]